MAKRKISSKKLSVRTPNNLSISANKSPPSDNAFHPSFSFKHLSDVNAECFTPERKECYFDFVVKMSQLNWSKISQLSKGSNGYESIPIQQITKYRKEIAGKLPEGTVNPLVFRIKNGTLQRMIGYRVGKIFYVILLDFKGECYSHG